jgi:hypothetical protein
VRDTGSRRGKRRPRWPLQTPPLMAKQTPPGRTVSIMSCWAFPVRCVRRPL